MSLVDEAAAMAAVSSEVAEAYADCWDYDPDQVGTGKTWDNVAKRRNLDFLATKWLPRDDAKWVLQQWVKDYNAFRPDLLDHLPKSAMVRIARECSVGLYVRGAKRLPSAEKMQADAKRPVILLGVECFHYWWD